MKCNLLRIVALLLLCSSFALGQQPVNVTAVSGTAPSTAGKIDIKCADGDCFVRQSTGSNLHAVIDTGSTTAVTQATGSNLHAVIDTGSTTTVTQGTGTNLHVVVDSAPSTTVSGTVTANLAPTTTGGLTPKHFVAAASDNATNLKSSAGQVYNVHVFSNATYPIFLKLYDSGSSPTGCGATNLKKVFGVQAGTEFPYMNPQGVAFASGIGYCLVKGITDADDTSVLISDASVEIDYK